MSGLFILKATPSIFHGEMVQKLHSSLLQLFRSSVHCSEDIESTISVKKVKNKNKIITAMNVFSF